VSDVVTFSPQQTRILRLLCLNGLTAKQVGARLGISPKTVDTHLTACKNKTGAKTPWELGWRLAYNQVLRDAIEDDWNNELAGCP
jgi:DNA-binding NarL/FixJ family response regulator